jgi:hypothetical protein
VLSWVLASTTIWCQLQLSEDDAGLASHTASVADSRYGAIGANADDILLSHGNVAGELLSAATEVRTTLA